MSTGDPNAVRRSSIAWAVASVLTLAQHAALGADSDDDTIERVIVTAQRREEALIDVPIAVSAFDATQLERRQIDQATDLQLNIPNVSYSKTNFTSSNFQIRGIGVSSVGASSDSGVETHFNSMPIKNPRLFETDYFDIERVEVLRGPQGTLYGRNATGGAVNVIPKKPEYEKFGGDVEVQGGNYHEFKAKGSLNIPVGEILAMRFAAIGYQRDGFTQNLYTGHDVDGRDQWAARAAFRLAATENTDVTLTINHYDENSNRARTTKQMCHRDPAGAYGCLPDRLAFEAGNLRAALGGTLGELLPLVAGFPALIAPGTDVNQGGFVPADLRQVYAEYDPTYEADETIATIELMHDFGSMTLTSVTGYQETSFAATTDYNWAAPNGNYNGPALALLGGSVPLSILDFERNGSLSGDVLLRSAKSFGYDLSAQEAKQWSQELRLSSDFESPLNFQIGALYFDATDDNQYGIATTELDYAAAFLQLQTPYFASDTPEAGLKSTAIFGELYWAMSDSFKWTAGLRWTQDEKTIKDRQLLLSVPFPGPLPAFREDETTFEEFTGRFGFDWKPGWFDDSTLYAFYSRGYKAGGFNPPFDRTNPAFAGTPPVYEPEFIDALEIGSKSVLAGGRVQANLTAFYYDYNGLQVSKIIARTSVNENIDAKIYGFEGEFVFSPVDELYIDLNLAYLNTSIENAQSIDPRDISNGNPAVTVVKDVQDASNYAIPTAQLGGAIAAGCILPLTLGGPYGIFGLNPACPGFAAFGVNDGEAVNLDGNQLGSAPEWSAKIGIEYTFKIGDFELTPRADYYWRDDFYSRIFNRPIDKIESWDVLNAQVTFAAPNQSWYLRGFVNNVMDDDNITGMYVTDASSGLFTNVFALDPRTYGLAVGFKF
jgi:iron complex outermembrane receptor protein